MTDETGDLEALAPEDDAAVAALLASLPELEMPADVATHVAAALAEQTPLSGPVPAWAAGGGENVTVLPSPREREKRRGGGLRVLTGVAAGVAAVVGLVVVGVNVLPGDDSGTSGGTTNAATGGQSGTAEQAKGTLLTSSGTTYSMANLNTQVSGLVASATAPDAPLQELPTESAPAPTESKITVADAKALIANVLALDVCLSKLDRAGEHPIAADAGTWSGQQAVVFVLRGQQLARVDVYVVAPACGDPADIDDHMLYFASVADTS